MVELDVIDDGKFRQVVHELRTFDEICRVILITFDDEVFTVRHPKADAEVLYYAANQEAGIKSAPVHDPGRDTCRRCLSVRSGDYEGATAANELFLNNLGL